MLETAILETLPIEAFEEEIMSCNAQYLIVEGETGSGKSTQIPQWYQKRGMRVLVTEPLIETVIGTSEYVADLMGVKLGTKVGYRTAEYRCDSPETEILFCTDGLALVRELSGHNRFDMLMLDELHQWNLNQSTLEAWTWMHLQKGDLPFKKVVVASATMDSDGLSRKRGNALVFKVPGRQFPIIDITQERSRYSVEDNVNYLVSQGWDVLVFQPGWSEIQKTISDLQRLSVNAELIPFHSGQLSREEKNRAYASYDRPKVIVSTNALETGRTLLPSIGRELAVVSSGVERRVELHNGIETLALGAISLAQRDQQKGRTGRVGEGVFIDNCLMPLSQRSQYPVAEIYRTRLDQTVLRLASVGYDASELPFYHEVKQSVIAEAKRALYALGAMTDGGVVTQIGHRMARMPLSVQFSRMIVEAEKLGVVDDVLMAAAILESGEVTARPVDRYDIPEWRKLVVGETSSDVMAQLAVYRAAEKMFYDEMRENGVHTKGFSQAKALYHKLRDSLRGKVELHSTGKREDIVKAVCAGMVDHLYRGSYGSYRNGDGGMIDRQLNRDSVVQNAEWLVGLPWDLQIKTRRGGQMTLNLIRMATKVDPAILTEIAPHLVRLEAGLNPGYDAVKDVCVSTAQTYFNKQMVREERLETPDHADAQAVFVAWIAAQIG